MWRIDAWQADVAEGGYARREMLELLGVMQGDQREGVWRWRYDQIRFRKED